MQVTMDLLKSKRASSELMGWFASCYVDEADYQGVLDRLAYEMREGLATELMHLVGWSDEVRKFSGNTLIEGHLFAAGSIRCGGSLTVSRSIRACGSIETEGSLIAGWDIFTGEDILSGNEIRADGCIEAEGRITVRRNIRAGESIEARSCLIIGGLGAFAPRITIGRADGGDNE